MNRSLACISVSLLLIPAFAPIASAGFVDEALESECDIVTQPIIDYVLCETGPILERAKAEAAWQETTLTNAASFYAGRGLAAAGEGLNAVDREVGWAMLSVDIAADGATTYATYLRGVGDATVDYAVAVVDGECDFWLGTCRIIDTGTTRSDVGGGIGEAVGCEPTPPYAQYVLCLVRELKADIEEIAAQLQAHYTGVVDGAVAFAVGQALGAVSPTLIFILTEETAVFVLAWGTVANGLELAGDLVVVAGPVPGYTIGLASAECGRLWSQCPTIVAALLPAVGSIELLA